MAQNFKPDTYLFAFNDGSYKRVTFVEYNHNQWIKMVKEDGTKVFVNPQNVNYIESITE